MPQKILFVLAPAILAVLAACTLNPSTMANLSPTTVFTPTPGPTATPKPQIKWVPNVPEHPDWGGYLYIPPKGEVCVRNREEGNKTFCFRYDKFFSAMYNHLKDDEVSVEYHHNIRPEGEERVEKKIVCAKPPRSCFAIEVRSPEGPFFPFYTYFESFIFDIVDKTNGDLKMSVNNGWLPEMIK